MVYTIQNGTEAMLFIGELGGETEAKFIGIVDCDEYKRGYRVERYEIEGNLIKDGEEFKELNRLFSKSNRLIFFLVDINQGSKSVKATTLRGIVTYLNIKETVCGNGRYNLEVEEFWDAQEDVEDRDYIIENVDRFRDKYNIYVNKVTDKKEGLENQYWDNKRNIKKLTEQENGLEEILGLKEENRTIVRSIEELRGVIDLYKGYVEKLEIFIG